MELCINFVNLKPELMKNTRLLLLFFFASFSLSVIGQNNDQSQTSFSKSDQSQLFNEVYVTYGLGSLYIFTGTGNHGDPSFYNGYYGNYYYYDDNYQINTAGSFAIGYNRMLNHIIMLGFTGSYQNLYYSKVYHAQTIDYTDSTYTASYNDNVLSGIAKVTFNYVNKPMVRVYSGVGMGVAVDLYNVQGTGAKDKKVSDRKILFAGQVTFMGVRIGRKLGGFCEFGIGTNSIVAGGVSYQFGD